MILQGKSLQKVYTTLQGAFSDATSLEIKFKKGEKAKVKRIFTLVAESQGIRDVAQIDTVLDTFHEYVAQKTIEWMLWDKRCRQNYFGFIDNKDNINLFVKSLTFVNPKKVNEETVKTKTNDQWEW